MGRQAEAPSAGCWGTYRPAVSVQQTASQAVFDLVLSTAHEFNIVVELRVGNVVHPFGILGQ